MPETGNPKSEGQPETASAALFGLCPRCGAKTLFDGMAKFAPRCRSCGLDYSQFNVGDGPAAFLTLIVGTIVAVLAIWLQLSFEPPFWVHAVLWIPVTTVLVIGGLRVAKAWLLGAEYRRRAGEGRIKD
ncbi:DUF983 domain-containing protein [Novosphingobium album (ex Hu et al. 2023)]|uniref:DUF983 domain-containing protein n=1 Tax=Novosphingobium album (ex Hu et al. 2023) TaxID=2930093 RepID=A0ABT0B0K8_9SPHN|nr:DUF983 domain-containing protein [Novosphingobium album (ex Hu et al. 2023)]MCJ2178550.1 DUF983 domain-containing protein [Novosphingobium album (ex Hu et al. 2023)]